MSVSHISTTLTNNSESSVDSISISTTASAGDAILLAVAFRDFTTTFSSPAWNGQPLLLVGSSNMSGAKVALYGVIATAPATANVTGSLDAFVVCNAGVTVARGGGGVLSIGAFSALLYESGTYANPSIVSASVASGDLIYNVLNGTGWDKDFVDVSSTTWAIVSPSTDRATVVNNSQTRVHTMRVGTGAGAGANYTSGWTASAGGPQYSQMVAVVSEAASVIINSVTTAGNPGLVVGQVATIATTGLGTLASVAIKTSATPLATVNGTSLSAPSGDGTFTMPYWVNGQKYPFIGTVNVTATDSAPLSANADFTLGLPATYISQTFASVLLPDATWLGYVLNAISHPLADNDRAYWPDVNGLTFGADSKISVTLADGATMVTDLWIQKADSTMEYYSLTINAVGEASIGNGIPTTNLLFLFM